MKKYLVLLSFPFLLVASCSHETYRKTDTGVIISLNPADESQPGLVKIEVINDNIFRISATPGESFPVRKSLAVLPRESGRANFSVSESEGSVRVSTPGISASVSLSTGALTFSDQDGNSILQESPEGEKSFTPITIDNSTGYSIRQVFESPSDEAFFGLGQHQSDEWNYKGKNEVLYQYNTKVSIPFVVSNRNYGILWDNYSLTRFGSVEEYANLSRFKLYNAAGEEGGLTATYTTADGEVFMERTEAEIDYENNSAVRKFPEGFPFWQSRITWAGEMEAAQAGEYEFKLYYAGYTTVLVDGAELVPQRWRTAWNPNTYKFRVHLEQGKRVPVSVQWEPDGGISYLGLKVLGPLDPIEQGKLSLWSEMGQEMDYYFIHGENMDGVISGYRTLTGKAPIMPQWAYGLWQSRERYKTQDEITGTLAEFRRRRIPIDNIVQDWSYWKEDQWGSHEFDAARFPDPAKMVKDIHAMNAHVMISVWPKFYINTEHYRELDQRGWIYQQAVKDSIRDWIGHGYIGSFYDAYSEGARKLFWEQMNENLYSLGIDAWWMDASEPDILSNSSLDYRKKLSGPTALGSSTEFLNTYALVNADAIFTGQRSVDPNKRVFLLTRSGFAGLQRYSTATWSGDIGTRWEDMKAQISAGLNFALSGIPYWTMDIGGFCVEHRYERAAEGSKDLEEWRELNTRWYQFGTFVPLYRSHGQYPYREVFHIAPVNHPAYRSIVKYNKLRYRLMPYIYSLAGKIHFDDYTLMRALVMDFPGDEKVTGISDQYMFGPSLMISPVYTYMAREREIWFPGSEGWYDLETGKFFTGGQQITIPAPYEKIPIHVKAGSIIPVGPDIQFVGEKPGDPILLYVYGGTDGEFTLYEDEGLNYNYEKGAFSKIRFRYEDATGTLVIGQREGTFKGMPENRSFGVVYVTKNHPSGLDPDARPVQIIEYTGTETTIKF
ncbi:MAG: TIM-barrel domain-containing protein [Bacteroidota bacterium]